MVSDIVFHRTTWCMANEHTFSWWLAFWMHFSDTSFWVLFDRCYLLSFFMIQMKCVWIFYLVIWYFYPCLVENSHSIVNASLWCGRIFSSWTSKQGPVGELCPCYYWLLKIHVPCTKAPGMMHGVYNENWKLLYLMKLHVIIDSLFFITSVLPRAAYWRGNAPEPSTTNLVPKLTVVWRKGPHRGGFMKQHNCIVSWWKEDVMMLALVRVESGFDLLYYGSIRYEWS